MLHTNAVAYRVGDERLDIGMRHDDLVRMSRHERWTASATCIIYQKRTVLDGVLRHRT